jgi:glycosyltransferase involved in cell wall biosynthesis
VRLLYVTPRYGPDVYGGAERAVREIGQHLAGRGHEVHVLTTCARSYASWENVTPPGDSDEEGIRVHRFTVDHTPPPAAWPAGTPVMTYWRRTRWALAGFPLEGAGEWLQRHSQGFDVTIPYTYQHHTTWDAVMLSRAPVLLHPAAHPEAALNMDILDVVFRRATMLSLHTPEERDLIRKRFRLDPSRLQVSGMGVTPLSTTDADIAGFRSSQGLGEDPYVVCVGRIDPGKGIPEVSHQFVRFKSRHPGPLRLVLVGEEVQPIPAHPEIVKTGFVPESVRNAAIAGAELLLQPSLHESFSLVLAEGWLLGVPVLAQGRSAVLRGQVARSGGGLTYTDDAGFEAGLDRLLGDPALRRRMARSGRRYITESCAWPRFLDAYEDLLGRVVERSPRRSRPPQHAAPLRAERSA